ncbi:aromatic motif membrane protein [Mycoplasma leonicaptivi]|uniref:aromatic motif membrane protein n=1 Tax=Mycoplasma leonicaptivi TaxID=36742 RepID=UPI0004834272|nr:aromatic motif membrane protein [Mycoplasma leonicaptivi]
MKKLLKISSLGLISILPFAIACKNTQEISYKNYFKQQTNVNQDKLAEIANEYFFDDKDSESFKKDFFNRQNSIKSSYTTELNVSLAFAPTYLTQNTLNIATNLEARYAQRSVEVLKQATTDNWYWILNNISKFTFLFNGFNFRFKDHKDEKNKNDDSDRQVFIDLLEKNKTLLFINKEMIIKTIFEFDFDSKMVDKVNDVYLDKKIVFVQFNDNVLLPFFSYKTQDSNKQNKHIQLVPEIFVFNNNITQDDVVKLYTSIVDAYVFYYDDYLDYAKKSNSNWNTEKENEAKKEINDAVYLDLYNQKSYYKSFYKAVKEFNKQTQNSESDLRVYRYAWGIIDEK